MHRLVALYHQPADPDQFRRHLLDVHLPIVAQFPTLLSLRHGFVAGTGTGEAPPYFAVVECDFSDHHALEVSLASEAGQAAAADVPNYAAAGVTIITYDLVGEQLGPGAYISA
jgi:uncharacterized protein (TIGR02118 family)